MKLQINAAPAGASTKYRIPGESAIETTPNQRPKYWRARLLAPRLPMPRRIEFESRRFSNGKPSLSYMQLTGITHGALDYHKEPLGVLSGKPVSTGFRAAGSLHAQEGRTSAAPCAEKEKRSSPRMCVSSFPLKVSGISAENPRTSFRIPGKIFSESGRFLPQPRVRGQTLAADCLLTHNLAR